MALVVVDGGDEEVIVVRQAEPRYRKYDGRWTAPKPEDLSGVERDIVDAVVAAPRSTSEGSEMMFLLNKSLPEINFRHYGQSPLFIACNTGKIGIVLLLLRWPHPHPLELDARSDAGETPFLAACRGGYVEIAQALAGAGGVNPNAKSTDGRSALWCAASKGHAKIVQFLFDFFGPGLVDWTAEARGLRGAGTTTTALQVARVNRHEEVAVVILKGMRCFAKHRAHLTWKKKTIIRAMIRVRDADGVFFGAGGGAAPLGEVTRETHVLGDEKGIDYGHARKIHFELEANEKAGKERRSSILEKRRQSLLLKIQEGT